MGQPKVSKILHFGPHTRLMCPTCGTISSKHKYHSPRREYYWDTKIGPHDVCLHTCHRCGYTDDEGPGFTDSGNDDRDEFKDLWDRENELNQRQRELDEDRAKFKADQALYARCWQSDEDYNG